MLHSLFWPFSNQEIILSMNFDGGRVKIEVRGTLFCVFAGKFYLLYRAYILKGDDICLSSAFFQSKLCFAYLNSRLIRPNQLETTFTGKKSTGECLKYFWIRLPYILPWLNGLGSYVAESGRAVRVQASTEPSFFPVVVSFFPFFISWYVFPLFPLLALYLSFTKFVISIFLSY